MLSKKVCLQCYLKQAKNNHSLLNVKMLEAFFHEDWEKGACRCKADGGTVFIKNDVEPSNCPYILEHVVERQSP